MTLSSVSVRAEETISQLSYPRSRKRRCRLAISTCTCRTGLARRQQRPGRQAPPQRHLATTCFCVACFVLSGLAMCRSKTNGQCVCLQQLYKRLCRVSRRCRILAGDQTAIDDDITLPVVRSLKTAAGALALVLDKKRHHVGQLHLLLLGVGKAGYALAIHERFTVVHYAMESAGRVTYEGNGLAGIVKGFEQRTIKIFMCFLQSEGSKSK